MGEQNLIPLESRAMKFFRCIGMRKISWSLRRLHCPVSEAALVLEVGSGGNPYYRSNVLVDAYEQTAERHWVPLISDRPTVLAFTEKLPFKDNAFDFVVASHVLEHSKDPENFLKEIQRVSKAGYIEVPDAFMERINPYPDHRLEITVRQGKLIIRKKKGWQESPDVVELYEDRAKKIVTQEVIPNHPFEFHVRYYWQDKIDYEIINPESSVIDVKDEMTNAMPKKMSFKGLVQAKVLLIVRRFFSQRTRNSKIDLTALLRCNNCLQSDQLYKKKNVLCCHACGSEFAIRNGIPDMITVSK